MTGNPSSPYYLPEDDSDYRKELRSVTCFQHKAWLGSFLDIDRNMWVCATCFKPGINSIYVAECIYCAEEFIPWYFENRFMKHGFLQHQVCNDCGGNNQAEPYKISEFSERQKELVNG